MNTHDSAAFAQQIKTAQHKTVMEWVWVGPICREKLGSHEVRFRSMFYLPMLSSSAANSKQDEQSLQEQMAGNWLELDMRLEERRGDGTSETGEYIYRGSE
ncbi:hypothetical protein ILYODFUR_025591 [Ilyodon furcidens]|uniref:Uncharacterized protein n=1 Tax=Ilyodon furcidens TaxID=33524 RepID=A0ABV0TN86_9TELE